MGSELLPLWDDVSEWSWKQIKTIGLDCIRHRGLQYASHDGTLSQVFFRSSELHRGGAGDGGGVFVGCEWCYGGGAVRGDGEMGRWNV